MSNDLTINNDRVPVPQKIRNGHTPSVGDIYYHKDSFYPDIYRITSVEVKEKYTAYHVEEYNLSEDKWEKPERETLSDDTLKEYYTLLIGDFDEILSIARAAVGGDTSAIDELLKKADNSPETLALVQSSPAEQVFALTEAGEMLQDKLQTIEDHMKMIIASIRHEMEAKLSAVNKKLSVVKDYVRNLQRIITVMNLYTGKNVDIVVVKDGEGAPAGLPVTIRQRILYMDEEYLASAENGGIDYNDIEEFNRWLCKRENLDIVLPEPKCIVAMKPKRYDADYSRDWYVNKALNQWNHHTYVFFRDGQRVLMIDSEDLELYGTAIPYSDQADRIAKEYEKLTSSPNVAESQIKALKDKTERLGYMYTKYVSFLQGIVDSGKIFDLSEGRPNLAKGEGTVYIYDDENAVGTGRNWETFQQEINSRIRRGTRILFHPNAKNGYSCGEPNRYYYHEGSAPSAPDAGVYNVDYPSKSEYQKSPKTGRYERVQKKRDKLAIFYTPKRVWKWDEDARDRTEGWIYNPSCCINYDALTIKLIDEFMSDRTQRPHFRVWMPLLQQARQRLVEEKSMEETFKTALGWEIRKENPSIPPECLPDLLDEAVHWWKNKVIFTRPLSVDDAKAWRMIKGEIKRKVKQNF